MTHHEESRQPDGYRWVILVLYCLVALGIWTSWFAQAPLLEGYWGAVFKIGAATSNLLLSLPGLVAIFLGISTGRWVDTAGVRKMLGLGAALAVIGFGLRPLFITSFITQALLTTIAGYGLCILTACLPPTMLQWFGHEKGHTFIGIGAASYFIGGGLGIIITANLVGAPPWTPSKVAGAFWVWTVVMVVVAVLWWLFARDKAAPAKAEQVSFGAEFKNVMSTPSSWINIFLAIFNAGTTVYVMGFLPLTMVVLYKMSPPLAGTVAGLYPIAMGVGLAVLPPLAGKMGKKGAGLLYTAIALIAWLVYVFTHTWTIPGLIVFALIFGFFFEAPWALGVAIQTSLPGVTPRNHGVASGVWTVGTNIGVFVLPLIMGAVFDSFKIPGGMWAIVIGYAISFVALLLVKENKA
ncbi:MAG: MFS transporter [Peptococcaceae bacterium]|nr:MFS transporter [Peptococcaceae bacterium]